MTLSIVIPCYNDSEMLKKTLPLLLDYLKLNIDCNWEVILSDDGSKDVKATEVLAEKLGVKFIGGSVNQGKGMAVRRGMLKAQGAFRIFTDSDLPFEFSAIDNFLEHLKHSKWHMVVGDRTLPNSTYYKHVPVLRKILSHLYSFLASTFVSIGIQDTQCGIKGFRAAVAEELFTVGRIKRFGFDLELFHIATKRNYGIKRLPVLLRFQGKSHVRPVQDGFLMFFDMLRLNWNRLLGRYDSQKPKILKVETTLMRKEIQSKNSTKIKAA